MKISGNRVTLIAIALMLLLSFLLTRQITYKEKIVKYASAEYLINDDKSMAMYSMKEIPKNVSKVSLLKCFMTNVGIFGEKVLVTYNKPVKIVGVEERSVQYKVKAIVILVKYSKDGVTNIVLEPLSKKDADIYIIATVILNEEVLQMKVLGVIVNSSEIVEIRGYIQDRSKRVPHAKLNVFMYKMEDEKNITEVSIEEVLTKGVLLYEVVSDYLGRFRIRILSSIVPKDYVIAIVASKEEGGYLVLENKPGISVNIVLKRGEHE